VRGRLTKAGEAVLQLRDRAPRAGSHVAADAGGRGAGQREPADVIDQRAMQSEQGVRDDARDDVAGLRPGLLGEERGERVRVAIEDLALARQ
jgi:hypothetical protein